MGTEFHERVQALLERAVAMPDEERQTYLQNACRGNAELLAEVGSLLPHYVALGDFDPSRGDRPVLCIPGTTTFTHLVGGSDADVDPEPPFSIPPYSVVETIGRGGMGVVYRAVHTRRHSNVAIKLCRRRISESSSWQHFKYEEEVLRQLNHPGIARYLHGGLARILRDSGLLQPYVEDRPYFVMEFIDGLPLTQFADQQQLNVLDRLALFVRICEAVEFAHHRGVIHKDLKPDNILVNAAGDPKVLDFGIATIQSFEPALPGRRTRSFAGTLAYASPEQRAGRAEDLRPASDVYSLGLILHELLTGTLPHRAGGRLALNSGRLELPGPAPRDKTAEFQFFLNTVLETALRRDPGHRYPTAGALQADLDRLFGAFAAPVGWRKLVEQLAGLLRARPQRSATDTNRLLATILRKRVGRSVEHDRLTPQRPERDTPKPDAS